MIRYIPIILFQIIMVGYFSIPACGGLDIPPTEDDKPLIVYVSLGINDIFNVDDNRQIISLTMVGRFRWKDPRLVHDGPNNIKRRLEEIWFPYLNAVSLQNAWSAAPKYAEIFPDGEVVYRINVRGEFSQSLNLRAYPFDRQIIRVPIVTEYSEDDVVLIPDPENPSYAAEKFTVADWDIQNFGIRSAESKLNQYEIGSRFEVYVEAVRRSNFVIIKIIIPLMLIVGMSWIVFWIDPLEIRSQFSVSVTTVLTLIAYHISLVARLPEIPYLTRMDVFIFGSTIMVFSSLLEVVMTSHLAAIGRVDRARRIDIKCRWLFPIVFAAVILFSFFQR